MIGGAGGLIGGTRAHVEGRTATGVLRLPFRASTPSRAVASAKPAADGESGAGRRRRVGHQQQNPPSTSRSTPVT